MANGTTPVLSHEEDDSVMNKKPVNPFVRMTAHDSMQSTSGGDVITRRILAPSQPTVVYSDDSKSAAILSTLLKSKVPKVEKEVRVVERTRASVVPLLGLRDKVARFLGGTEMDVCKDVSSSDDDKDDDGKNQNPPSVPCRDDDEVVVVEEINLVSSSSSDDDGGRGRGQQEAEGGREQRDDQVQYSREETPSRMRSTGVALFDAFTADEDYYEDEIEEYEEAIEDEDDDHTELKSARMVDIDGTMQPWWKRFPDFVPVSELAGGSDPRNGSTVFVNYMSQFKGTKIAQVGMSSRKSTKRKSSSGGHWISKDGERCFVTDCGENLTGRAAYVAYKKAKPSHGRSKQSTRKRRRKKPKKKS